LFSAKFAGAHACANKAELAGSAGIAAPANQAGNRLFQLTGGRAQLKLAPFVSIC